MLSLFNFIYGLQQFGNNSHKKYYNSIFHNKLGFKRDDDDDDDDDYDDDDDDDLCFICAVKFRKPNFFWTNAWKALKHLDRRLSREKS